MEAGILWERDGHLFTTFLVSSFAEVPKADKYAITYYCQYADDDHRYNATVVSLKYLLVPWRWCWRTDINKELHSLHGGDNDSVRRRRTELAKLIKSQLAEGDANRLWQAGLMIHALGDSYSHTKGEFGQDERAYGPLYGHAFVVHFPDQVAHAEVFPKYAAYVRNLFDVLSPPGNVAGKQGVEKYLADLSAKVCRPNEKCGSQQIENVRAEIIKQANEQGGFSEKGYSDYSNAAPRLTKADIQKVMDQIKRATAPAQ